MVYVVKKFKLLITAQEAKAVAPLASNLGQYNLNCVDFCKQFNEQTKQFEIGTPLCVDFFVLSDKQFKFRINRLVLRELVPSLLRRAMGRRRITLMNLYKLYRIVKHVISTSSGGNNIIKLSTFMGYIRTLKVRRVIIKKKKNG